MKTNMGTSTGACESSRHRGPEHAVLSRPALWRMVGLVGIPLVGTGLVGWCPAYLPFGIDTR